MYTWMKKRDRDVNLVLKYTGLLECLRELYKTKLQPIEHAYNFHDFNSSPLEDSDFEYKPMFLLMGQYSTGKTTFIKYVLEKDFPGMKIGPEPTTDFFTVVSYGEHEGAIPGNALVVDANKPYKSLSRFGANFLNKFQSSVVNSPVLRCLTLVDTPGILFSVKERVDRGYDFPGALYWFAQKSDRILLMFDANKLDISDELKTCFELIRGQEDKVRIVLNKADGMDYQDLMQVYGSLMWSLGKLINSFEVARVYIGSFWDKPLTNDTNRKVFQVEEHELFNDMQNLPRYAALRKLNDLVKRARQARVHAFIIAFLKKEMPLIMGKQSKKQDLILNLESIYAKVQKEYNLPFGDMPNKLQMQEYLQTQDFDKFQTIKPKLFEAVKDMLDKDIPELLKELPTDDLLMLKISPIHGGLDLESSNPFRYKDNEEAFDATPGEMDWVVNKTRIKYDAIFDGIQNKIDGKVTAVVAKQELTKSKLPNTVLARIWKMADIDKDGMLDRDEFALAMYLAEVKASGCELPAVLPIHLLPPNKRYQHSVVSKTESNRSIRSIRSYK